MKLFRSKKAISPIFAVLILIAIAVIAGIVVYMFTSGTIATMTGGGTAAQEKAAVQGVTYDGSTAGSETITAYATCVEGGPIDITGLIVKDSEGNTEDAITITPGTYPLPETGNLVKVGPLGTVALDPLKSYTVTLTSANGGSFVSSSFKP
jgi:flagellin-like protein